LNRSTASVLCGLVAWGIGTTARADEPSPVVKPFLVTGLVEVVGLAPVQHLGLYATVAVDVGFVLSDDWMVLPSIGFEFAPENGHWGGTFFLIVDRYVAKAGGVVITLEPQIGILHDAAPRAGGGFDHAFFGSAALGVAFITDHFAVIPQLGASVGLAGEGWSISPMVLFSVPF
jgi:hypothetical protein